MILLRSFGLALLFLLGVSSVHAASPLELWFWQGATVTPLLTPAARLDARLTSQFEVLGKGRVIALGASGELVDVTAQRLLPAPAPLGVTSFTADAGLLIVLQRRRLGWYEDGRIVDRFVVPQDGLTVVAGPKQRLFLYGPEGAGSAIYAMDAGKAGKLLEVPDGRISALTAIGERLFFAVDNTIYTAAAGQPPAALFLAAGETGIRSLAADPVGGLLFFSTDSSVFALRAGVAVSVLRGLGGGLRQTANGLFVLDPDRRALVRITGLDRLTEVGRGTGGNAGPPSGQFKE